MFSCDFFHSTLLLRFIHAAYRLIVHLLSLLQHILSHGYTTYLSIHIQTYLRKEQVHHNSPCLEPSRLPTATVVRPTSHEPPLPLPSQLTPLPLTLQLPLGSLSTPNSLLPQDTCCCPSLDHCIPRYLHPWFLFMQISNLISSLQPSLTTHPNQPISSHLLPQPLLYFSQSTSPYCYMPVCLLPGLSSVSLS